MLKKIQAAKAISMIWLGSLAAAGLALLTNVVLAREMGPSSFGQFSSSLAIVTIVSPLAGFGTSTFLLKVFGQEGWAAVRWIRPTTRFIILSSFAVCALLIVWVLGKGLHTTSAYLVLILLPLLFAQAATSFVASKLQLEEEYLALALWQVLVSLARLVAVYLAFRIFTASVVDVASIYAIISIVTVIFAIGPLKKTSASHLNLKGHGPRERISLCEAQVPSMRSVASKSWQFGIGGFIYLAYYQCGIILLENFAGVDSAGIYNAAFLIVGATYLLPAAIFQKFLLSKLHRWAHTDTDKIALLYRKSSMVMLIVGIMTALFLGLNSAFFVEIIYGEKFQESAGVLALLALCIPLRFFAASADAILASGPQLRRKLTIQAAIAILNVLIGFAFIPRYGLMAAVISTIASELFMMLLLHFAARSYIRNF